MHNFPPNTNPEVFTITAIIVGLVLEDDFTSDELNSMGNWLMLVAQLILTTAAQQQLINNRYQKNTGSRIKSDSRNHSAANPELVTKQDLDALNQKIRTLESYLNSERKTNYK